MLLAAVLAGLLLAALVLGGKRLAHSSPTRSTLGEVAEFLYDFCKIGSQTIGFTMIFKGQESMFSFSFLMISLKKYSKIIGFTMFFKLLAA